MYVAGIIFYVATHVAITWKYFALNKNGLNGQAWGTKNRNVMNNRSWKAFLLNGMHNAYFNLNLTGGA